MTFESKLYLMNILRLINICFVLQICMAPHKPMLHLTNQIHILHFHAVSNELFLFCAF